MQPKILYSEIGETIQFVCIFSYKVFWTFEEGALPHNAYPFRYKRSWDYWIRVVNVQIHNQGKYTCTSTNKRGQKYHDYGILIVEGLFIFPIS